MYEPRRWVLKYFETIYTAGFVDADPARYIEHFLTGILIR